MQHENSMDLQPRAAGFGQRRHGMTMRPTMPAGGTRPQLVECAYGHPNCVNPDPGPKAPKVGGVKLPDDGWTDPDCQYYSDLCTPEPAPWFGFPTGTFDPK
jgi:hypothetical protein